MATGAVTTALSYDNALLATLAVYGSLLVLKFLFVSAVTNWPAYPHTFPFLLVGLFYVLTSPEAEMATLLIRVFAAASLVDMLLPEFVQKLAYFVGTAILAAMAVQVVMVTLENFKELKYIYQLRDLVMKQLK
ncbi:uncharacterized protein LOC118407692 [Branchiostoma floridae]|uniref:Uncharacterized protein LOC118407692 n=1 Tax=Branchiostoma floridae TaxID=7739 RepID=A0A9J7KKL1_BRAFL|nr:uncharacterized protein LOC118407692 [Branchiostoma floridae]